MSVKHLSCTSAALDACNYGTHSINNIGACIAYKNRILSVGWNTGDRTRLKGTLGRVTGEETVNACKDCVSVHAEVAAWMQLPKIWKSRSLKSAGSSTCRRTAKYCEKGRVHQEDIARHLHRSQDSRWQGQARQAMRELSSVY